VRKHLKLDDKLAVWFAPGELLIVADRQTHAAAAKEFESLKDPQAGLEGELAKLQAATAKRYAARKDELANAKAARQREDTALKHQSFGWQLLSAAAGGQLDLEALTELQIAWKQPDTAELLKGQDAALAIRSAWILAEASRALPGERELADLARAAQERSREAVEAAIKALEAKPEDELAFFAVLYASLARRDEAPFLAKAKPLLTSRAAAESALADARQVAAALLSPPDDAARQALAELASRGVSGSDLVVLTALACRRAGGEAWDTFRAESRDLIGGQALPGSVVVLVNRLAHPQLPLAMASR
jgi:hypothetical protein